VAFELGRCRAVLHVEQAREVAGSDPAASFTATAGDAGLSEPDQCQDAVVLFGPLYHLTDSGPQFFTTAYFHAQQRPEAGGRTGWFLQHGHLRGRGSGLAAAPEVADPHRREQILFAARSVETELSLIGFSCMTAPAVRAGTW
jgi:hypothetical protein